MADSRAGRKGTRRVHGEGRACNSFQIKKKESWRRGESNDTPLLITRNLLKKRDAQNAITALCPIPMYKIMYNEIGRCGVAHRLRCYEDCEKLLRVRFKSPSLGSASFVDVRAAFVAQREAAEAMQPGQGCVRQPSGRRRGRCHDDCRAWRALDAAGAMDAENAPTALSSCDDFQNGQKTPCLRTARTYPILTAPAAGWFFKRATVRQPEIK